MNDKFLATIGLEIHAELKTSSKMFCSCKNDPDEEKPNANICPVCMGHPGTLPVLNKEAIKHVLKIGYAIDGSIADFTEWDRKNYFYPDIPKGYQISQYKYPLISGGKLAGIELTRIHLEEDTAQSTHDVHENSLVNFNRAGVPLMELVTEPVINSAESAVAFAKELQLLLRYLKIGEANLEKGEMRVEANISVASPENTKVRKFGTKTEVKNLNSFKAVEKAIAFEINRQIKLIEKGESVIQETRGWDENTGTTYTQRVKENSHDYRYFPDPDIPKLKISEVAEFDREHMVKEIPELPWIKRDRFIKDFKTTDKEVAMFIDSSRLANYFESVIAENSKIIKLSINYILNTPLDVTTINPNNFAKLMTMIDERKISSTNAKDIIVMLVKEDIDPEILADKNGLIQKNDEGEIKKIVEEILSKNTVAVDEYKKGKIASLQFLVGQGMKVTKGSANPELLKKIILDLLK